MDRSRVAIRIISGELYSRGHILSQDDKDALREILYEVYEDADDVPVTTSTPFESIIDHKV